MTLPRKRYSLPFSVVMRLYKRVKIALFSQKSRRLTGSKLGFYHKKEIIDSVQNIVLSYHILDTDCFLWRSPQSIQGGNVV